MKVINLYAGPGCGKSTLAAGIFHSMKSKGLSVELVDEYAKQMTWEDRQKEMPNQIYIFAKQYKKLQRLIGKVDYAVTDSPLLFSLVYPTKDYFSTFPNLVRQVYDSFDNRNFLLERIFPFVLNGRNQDERHARIIDERIRGVLWDREFSVHRPDEEGLIEKIISKAQIRC